MSRTSFIWLFLFWVMQIGAHLLFKYGATAPGRYWIGFVCGNIIGASSILLLIKLYEQMQVNVAGALALGGGFLVAQVSLALVYRQGLAVAQYVGIVVIAAGMMMVTWGAGPATCKSSGSAVDAATAPQIREAGNHDAHE